MTPRTQTTSTTNHQPITLPQDGMSRLSQLLPFIPLGKSTVWAWVRQGKFPEPIKLSDNVTVWRNSDIHAWLNNPNNYQGGQSTSHCKQIYQHLMTGKEINPMQALNLFGCFALSQRIHDLKHIHGVPVQTRLHYAQNGKKWSIYWLEPYYINQVKAGVIEPFCCVS